MALWCLASWIIEYYNNASEVGDVHYTPHTREHVYKLFDDSAMKLLPELITEDKLIDMLYNKDNAPANIYVTKNKKVRVARSGYFKDHVIYTSYSTMKTFQGRSTKLGLDKLPPYDGDEPWPNASIGCIHPEKRDEILKWLYGLNKTIGNAYLFAPGIWYFPWTDSNANIKDGSVRRVCIGTCEESVVCITTAGVTCTYAMDDFIHKETLNRYNVLNVEVYRGALHQIWVGYEVPERYEQVWEYNFNKLSSALQNQVNQIIVDRSVGRLLDRPYYTDKSGRLCVYRSRLAVDIYMQNYPYKLLRIVPVGLDATEYSTVDNITDFVMLSGPEKLGYTNIVVRGKFRLPDTIKVFSSNAVSINGVKKLDLTNTKLSLIRGVFATDAEELLLPSTAKFSNAAESGYNRFYIPCVKDLVLPDDMIEIPISGMHAAKLERLVLPMKPMQLSYYEKIIDFIWGRFSVCCKSLREVWSSIENKDVAQYIVGKINKNRKELGWNLVKLIFVRKTE